MIAYLALGAAGLAAAAFTYLFLGGYWHQWRQQQKEERS